MGDPQISHPLVNQIMLNLENMGSMLNCTSCYNLLNQPKVLTCKHVICSACVATLTNDAFCPLCGLPFLHQDLRPDVHVETVVNLYKTMNSLCTSFRNNRPHDILRNTKASKPRREEQNGRGVQGKKSLDMQESSTTNDGKGSGKMQNYLNDKLVNEDQASRPMLTPEKQQSFGQLNASPNVVRNWLLCGSALSFKDKKLLVKFANLIGANVSESWNPDVTHVIASTDKDGACSRTSKFLMAILRGKWVVNMKWIEEGISCGHPVGEESYEISHDVHGTYEGPRRGRIRVMDQEPKLFDGLSFYFNGHSQPSFKDRLEGLVVAAGGLLLTKGDLMNTKKSNTVASTKVFVVYFSEPAKDCSRVFDKVVEIEAKEAEALACSVGARTIRHTWILDSIAGCDMLRIG